MSSDPWLQAALDAGGHLGDDVARALLEDELRSGFKQDLDWSLYRVLISDEPALD